MPVALRKRKRELAIAFTDEITIYQAEAVAADLKGILGSLQNDEEKPVVADLKAVTDIDSSGVQLLLAMEKSLANKQLALARVDHCHQSQSLFDLYKLSDSN